MNYHIETIELKEYVKGVLPNEWLATWNDEALKAGAVAVKNYTVSTYNRKGYLWDCNYDQVYNPDKRTPQTDRAVDDTWDWWLWDDGIVTTFYDDYQNACATRGYECMSQYWTSEVDLSWDDMITNSYEGGLVIIPPDRIDMIRRYK